MFTGIVETIGRVVDCHRTVEDVDLVVESEVVAARLSLGASIALDGVCQTVTRLDGACFTVHAIAETLRVTTLGQLGPGSLVNLETPLAAGAPLGGHFVQGHVDGVATIESSEPWGDSVRLRFAAPRSLVAQMVPKGSVCIDGISLTVGPDLTLETFDVFLIPHTLQVTTLGTKQPGDAVNLETDILGKYLLRYLETGASGIYSGPGDGA
jgi:riboflavin synthase